MSIWDTWKSKLLMRTNKDWSDCGSNGIVLEHGADSLQSVLVTSATLALVGMLRFYQRETLSQSNTQTCQRTMWTRHICNPQRFFATHGNGKNECRIFSVIFFLFNPRCYYQLQCDISFFFFDKLGNANNSLHEVDKLCIMIHNWIYFI